MPEAQARASFARKILCAFALEAAAWTCSARPGNTQPFWRVGFGLHSGRLDLGSDVPVPFGSRQGAEVRSIAEASVRQPLVLGGDHLPRGAGRRPAAAAVAPLPAPI